MIFHVIDNKTKKYILKKNHVKNIFTQNYMFDANKIKHCTKMLKFYKIEQQNNIVAFNIII